MINETFRFVGPAINPQLRHDDFPFEELGQGPIVYISLGTVHQGSISFYQTCFQAFADYPAQFILSVGRQTPMERLGAIPDNFIVRPFVPQLEVLQRSDLFITHGGINSLHEGLYYGVPLVIIPHQFEQLLNARRVAARGAGRILDEQLAKKPLTAVILRQVVEEVLSQPGYTAAAQEAQRLLEATGGYQQAASELQAYTSLHGVRSTLI